MTGAITTDQPRYAPRPPRMVTLLGAALVASWGYIHAFLSVANAGTRWASSLDGAPWVLFQVAVCLGFFGAPVWVIGTLAQLLGSGRGPTRVDVILGALLGGSMALYGYLVWLD